MLKLIRLAPAIFQGISSWRVTRARIKLMKAEAFEARVSRENAEMQKIANAIAEDAADGGLIDLEN